MRNKHYSSRLHARSARSAPFELEELIATVHASTQTPGREVEALVKHALDLDRRFSARLALRALHIEQALRDAHERTIVLQWELGQALRRERGLRRASDAPEGADYARGRRSLRGELDADGRQ